MKQAEDQDGIGGSDIPSVEDLDRRDGRLSRLTRLFIPLLLAAVLALAWLLLETIHADMPSSVLALEGTLALLAVSAIVVLRQMRLAHARLRKVVGHLAESDQRSRLLAAESETLRALLVDAVDSIDEGFVLFDRDNRLVVCNERYRTAYPAIADLLQPGMGFDDILTTAAERMGVAEGATGRGLQHWVHQRMRRHLEYKDFTECRLSDNHWYRISERPTRSGGIVKVLMDITAAKTHEQDLSRKNELLETVFDAMSQGLAVFDETHRLTAWNERFARVMGYPATLLKSSATLADFLDYDDRRQTTVLADIASGDSVPRGHEVVLPDGRAVEAQANPLPRGGFVATFADVTARRQAEATLQQSQKMDAIGQLAGGIAHEFNNMLTSIGGFARMALRTPEDKERVVMCLSEVTKAADRAASMTGQLLNFSRRTADEEVRPWRVGDLMRDISGFLRPLLGEHIGLSVQVADPDVTILADAARLHQAVINLCINARDAMPEGGDISIRVDTCPRDDAFARRHPSVRAETLARIEVADTGQGIDEAIIDRIYEPFFTTKEPGKGTGLGLPQVYSTVEHLGGAVEVVSRPGEGTCFTLFLPLQSATPAPSALGPPAVAVNGDGYTILLAEDEEAVRQYITLLLEEAGFTVLTAADGLEAQAIFRDADDSVDCLLTDVIMPNLSGPALANSLLTTHPDLPVVFMSGYSAEDSWKRLIDHPRRTLIAKPAAPDAILTAVARVLDLPTAAQA
jgi:PAS domain S-box-containing protein